MRKISILLLICMFFGCSAPKKSKNLESNLHKKSIKKSINSPVEHTYGTSTDDFSSAPPPPPPAPAYSKPEYMMEEASEKMTMAKPSTNGATKNKSINRTNQLSAQNRDKTTKIDFGEIVYKVPDTMVVFSEYKIVVRISKKSGTAEITESLGNDVIKKTIPVTSEMEVLLIDSSPDSAFSIKKINSDGQIIDSLDYTEWQFIVKPLKFGDRTLSLVVSVVRDGELKQKVYSDTIHVKNNIKKEVGNFWSKYWQWIITTFLIPIFVYFWKRKKKED